MNSVPLLARMESRKLATPEPVRILIVYEDMVTGQKARLVSEQLVGSLGPSFKCEPSLWKFDVLQVPDISAIAAYEARRADLIVFAAHEGKEMDDKVKQWIQQWLPHKERGESCIVALLLRDERCPTTTSPLYSYLRKIAVKRGLDFFWQQLDSDYEAPLSHGKSPSYPGSSEIHSTTEFHQASVHWGIND